MPAVSKKQQRFFGYLLSNPEERKKKGISKKDAKDFAQDVKEGGAWTKKAGKNPEGGLNEKGRKSYERENPGSDLKAPSKKVGNKRRASFCARMGGMKKKLTSSKTANDPDSRINKALRKWKCNEVAPPGWGHTKAEKEKTKPDNPTSKIGGSAAAFKRDLDSGKFKGLPGDKTKKEKTASMFKIMWAAKNKGYKPHYKPGTDKKYKKYQEEKKLTPMQDNNLFGNAYAGSYEDLKKEIGSKKKPTKPAVKEASFADYMAQAQAARERQKDKQDTRKKRDVEFVDRKKHGVKFYDKKGSGRIVKGRKVYD